MNELYDTFLYTAAGAAISLASKKVLGKNLGVPDNVEGTLKLVVALAAGTMAVKYAQRKKFIPDDPFE